MYGVGDLFIRLQNRKQKIISLIFYTVLWYIFSGRATIFIFPGSNLMITLGCTAAATWLNINSLTNDLSVNCNSIYWPQPLTVAGCQIYGFLGGLTGTVSIMTLASIALDRYYVIVYPLDPLRRTTRLRARICVLLVWCYGSVFASLPLSGLSRYVPEGKYGLIAEKWWL